MLLGGRRVLSSPLLNPTITITLSPRISYTRTDYPHGVEGFLNVRIQGSMFRVSESFKGCLGLQSINSRNEFRGPFLSEDAKAPIAIWVVVNIRLPFWVLHYITAPYI